MGYSANVAIQLIAADREFNVAKLRSDSCVLRNPDNVPPCAATLIVTIDERIRSEAVYLPDGIDRNQDRVRFTAVAGARDENTAPALG